MAVTLAKTYRYELTIYGPSGRVAAHSFTWGTSPANASARVGRQFTEQEHVWEGHSFKINPRPTLSIPTIKVPQG